MTRTATRLLIAAAAAAAAVYAFGIRPRLLADTRADDAAVGQKTTVTVFVAARSSAPSDLTLPASLRAFQDTPIIARTTGYLGRWNVDIGDRVKAGQTLAVIDGPDLDQQLNQARANLGQAQANLTIARISAERWKQLGAQNAVSQQDVDQRTADFAARTADVTAAQANVDRLVQLKDFQVLKAPYDGVISARNAQVGTLISAGMGPEIFHIAQTDILRVYVDVPQAYLRSLHPGLSVDVLVPEFPRRRFAGRVTRTSGALDAASRTLLTEVQVPNVDGALLPGMFGQVVFKLQPAEPAILLPSNAAIVRAEGTLVASVGADNRIHLLPVTLGRDFGSQIEILDGIEAGMRIVANPTDSLTEDLPVEAVSAAAQAGGQGQAR